MTTLPLETFLDSDRTTGEMKSQFFGPMLDVQAETPGGGPEQALTIASGSITPANKASRSIVVDTEASASTDDLDSIVVANTLDGADLWLRSTNATRVITLRHAQGGSGQMLLRNGAAYVLDDPEKQILLRRVGTNWIEVLVSHDRTPDAARGYIDGLILSNSAVDANNDIDITLGLSRDDADSSTGRLSATATIALDASGDGGLDTGSKAADTSYHVHSIWDSTGTNSPTGLFSISASAPTMPSGYDKSRRIGSVLTDGSSNIIGFTQRGDEFLRKTPIAAFNASNPGTSAVLRTVAVPTGIQVLALNSYELLDSGFNFRIQCLITSPDQSDTAPGQFLADLQIDDLIGSVESMTVWTYKPVRTNTSGEVRTRLSQSTIATSIVSTNHGWIDSRGKE